MDGCGLGLNMSQEAWLGAGRMVFRGSQSIVPSLLSSVQRRIWGQGRQGRPKAYVSLNSSISLFVAMALERQESNSVDLPGPEELGLGQAAVVGGHLKTTRLPSNDPCFFPAGFRITVAWRRARKTLNSARVELVLCPQSLVTQPGNPDARACPTDASAAMAAAQREPRKNTLWYLLLSWRGCSWWFGFFQI